MSVAPEFLRGFRALDLAGHTGQLRGRMLSDLGMEVVKIEPPGGDPVRRPGAGIEAVDDSLNSIFAHLNGNKESIITDVGHTSA